MIPNKALRILLATVVVGIVLAMASCSMVPSSFHGEVVRPDVAAPQFSMVDQHGNPFELRAMEWNDYGVTVLDGGETHSSLTYVIDQESNLRLHFDSEMPPEDIASDLKTLLASN